MKNKQLEAKISSFKSYKVQMIPPNFVVHKVECCYQPGSLDDLKAHLKRDLVKGEAVQCPFDECRLKFRGKSSFSSHLTRKHATNGKGCVSSVYRSADANSFFSSQSHQEAGDLQNSETDTVEDQDDSFENEHVCDFDISEETDSMYLKLLATLYLKLQGKCLLPSSIASELIASEFQEAHRISQSIMMKRLNEKLSALLPPEDANDIKSEVNMNDLFSICNSGPLETVHKRSIFYRKHFGYTSPVEGLLGYERLKKAKTYQYMPKCKSLSALLKYHGQSKFRDRKNKCRF